MDIQKVKNFWIEEAEESLRVAYHLFEKKDYSYALFFGHLAVEKILKALYVANKKEHPPYIHNLPRLAEMADIKLTEKQKEELIKITTFNLETRYPDENRAFRKKCTEGFTTGELSQTDEVFKWLKSMLP
ncbi:MAG: HEPN domain-containing protein [Thermodesulfovibrionales bacterium]|nr:HEPN domain-containing protein [Thermodesulfovibrionales bacterium]